MSDKLSELRARIDQIDDAILDHLARRADLVDEVAAAKRAGGALPFHDPEREQRVLQRLLGRGAGRFPAEAIRATFREIMSGCLSLEEPQRVAFLGPEGTFSHMAARYLFGTAARFREASTITGVFDMVAARDAACGVVPVENSTEGSVATTADALLESAVQIRQELVLDVSHCLLSRAGGLTRIERVHSHPQALGQCRVWLARNLPQAQLVQTPSTAAAVREALLDERAGAVASHLAAELYGVPVLRERIQDRPQNATRFLVIAPDDAPRTGADKTTVAFTLRDEPGALCQALALFQGAGVNLCRIESRPSQRRPWDYAFLVDLFGHRQDPEVAGALEALAATGAELRVLGSYPRSPGRPDRVP